MPWRAHLWLLVALATAVALVAVIAVETGGWFAPVFGIVAAGAVFFFSRRIVRRKLGKPG